MTRVPVYVPYLVLGGYAVWAVLIVGIGVRWGWTVALLAVAATFAWSLAHNIADRHYRLGVSR